MANDYVFFDPRKKAQQEIEDKKKLTEEEEEKLFRKTNIGTNYVKFNVNSLLRGNIKDRSDYYKTAITNGWMTINEVREKEDMNKVIDGDDNYIPLNMTTIENN